MYSHPSKDSTQVAKFTRQSPFCLYLHMTFAASERSGFSSTTSTNILSPSQRGRYFPARLCKMMSKASPSAGFEPGDLEIVIILSKRKDTLESWVLVMVERHFSTNWQGRSVPNKRSISRRLGQRASESPL